MNKNLYLGHMIKALCTGDTEKWMNKVLVQCATPKVDNMLNK